MIVLGIDQASATGWAVWSDGSISASGTVYFKGSDKGKKFSEFERWLKETIQRYNPDVLFFEAPHFRGYSATVVGVGMVALMHKICYEVGVPLESVHSQTLKKYATGKGFKVDKDAMTEAAAKLVGKELSVKKDNNEADAIHLAYYGGDNWEAIN
jgi:Holliday junction resolvasome RuvABC endonuclease subunit